MDRATTGRQTAHEEVERIAQIAAVPAILDVVCDITGLRFAAVARVTADQWLCCAARDAIGLELKAGTELDVGTTLCDQVRAERRAIAIDDVSADPVYRNHRTPRLYGFRSYIATPIILADGRFFGTLCALDPRPATVANPGIMGLFALLADVIATHLDLMGSLSDSRGALADAHVQVDRHEQFVAVLGHDLRNPLAAIASGVRLLEREGLSERGQFILSQMRGSVDRMSRLIDSILDLALGRLGGGLPVTLRPDVDLGSVLDQVVRELRTARSDARIILDCHIPDAIAGDDRRLAQLLSNLIENALTHGTADTPVTVHARQHPDGVTIAITNRGTPIPAAAIPLLFEPFARGPAEHGRKSLGLGLWIADQIARAHGGAIAVRSDTSETCFTVSLPRAT